ncbi:MAG TPA: YegP family protein [Acidobacteriota bacterium]|nr:YegP family protein [Acidobacteriota bacterium]HOT01202.1 YegP family protein [Acidobacteriota bacterium]HQF88525.1 YegP family protein [Acidobacteriota bacterium]HQG92793.1 YegP family protein [Acidobacteriota bacterium]
MAAKFELKKSKSGQFTFNLKAANGQVILTSELYNTKPAAENGIASVQKNAAYDDRYERKVAKDGQHFFVLKAANLQVIGKSELYKSAASMEKGIASVKKNGPVAKISDCS